MVLSPPTSEFSDNGVDNAVRHGEDKHDLYSSPINPAESSSFSSNGDVGGPRFQIFGTPKPDGGRTAGDPSVYDNSTVSRRCSLENFFFSQNSYTRVPFRGRTV